MKKTQGKKFKASFVLMLILIFCSLFCAAISAEEPESVHNEVAADDVQSDTTTVADEASPDDKSTGTQIEDNPFSLLWCGVKDYATEIFCALTFIASLFLSYAYKRGLLPTVSGAIGTLSTLVSKIKESTEREGEKSDAMSEAFASFLEKTKEALEKSDDKLQTISDKLRALDERQGEQDGFKTVLEGQVELLYDVFMSSSLPQYKKDEIGERVAKMKEALKENGNGQTD